MGLDAPVSASQQKQLYHQWDYPVEREYRQEAIRGRRVCNLLRYCQPQWSPAQKGLQDMQEEIPWQLHHEVVQ